MSSHKKNLQEILKSLLLSRITGEELRQVVDHFLRRELANPQHSGLGRERILDIIQDSLIAFKKAPFTKSEKEPDYAKYFERVVASKFCDCFRKEPDANIYSRVKNILKTPVFVRASSGAINANSTIHWETAYWQPAQWEGVAERMRSDVFDALASKAVTFAEAGIPLKTSLGDSVMVKDEELSARMLFLFEEAFVHFGKRLAMRAADIKEVICQNLWIVPRNPTSYSNDSPDQGDSDEPERPGILENIGEMPHNHLAFLDLEDKIEHWIRDQSEILKLWLLYQRCLNEKTGTPKLEVELKKFPDLPQRGHSMLNKELNGLAEVLFSKEIDLNFDGAREVVIQVLGKYFSRFYKPADSKENSNV